MPLTDPHETEAKFAILNQKTVDRFAGGATLAPGYQLLPPHTAETVDVYYDTPSFDLIRRGLALRTRRSGERLLVTAKSLEARRDTPLYDRVEREEPVDHATGKPPYLAHCSAELSDLVAAHNPDSRKLRPVVTLRQTRLQRLVQPVAGKRKAAKQSAPLAELSLDDVRVYERGANADGSSPAARFRELEVELLPDGDVSKLERLADRLGKRAGLRRRSASKLEAALEAISEMAPGADVANPDIQPAMHMAEACRLIWRRQIMQVVLQENGARIGDDPEYVHEMRVAIRRARTAQELFGHYFRRSAIEPAFADLRRLGRRLGAVRDLDVALENLAEFRAGLPEAEQADVCKLEEFVRARRAAARQALLEWLDGPQHAATLTAFIKFTRSPGKGVKRSVAKLAAPAPLQVRHVMPGVIMERFARVRAYEPLVETESEAPAEQMHALRIECKYLRYSLEFSRHLLGKEGEALIDQLKRMQDHLGAFNDTFVERERLLAWQKDGLDEKLIHARLQDLSDTAARLQAEFPAAYRAFVAHDNRRLLGEALAHI